MWDGFTNTIICLCLHVSMLALLLHISSWSSNIKLLELQFSCPKFLLLPLVISDLNSLWSHFLHFSATWIWHWLLLPCLPPRLPLVPLMLPLLWNLHKFLKKILYLFCHLHCYHNFHLKKKKSFLVDLQMKTLPKFVTRPSISELETFALLTKC